MAPNIFGRVAQWLANEVIVKGLANNPAFQRFAVRSSQQAQELTKKAAETARSLTDNPTLGQLRNESEALKERASGFAAALREELEEAARKARDQVNEQMGDKKGPPPRR